MLRHAESDDPIADGGRGNRFERLGLAVPHESNICEWPVQLLLGINSAHRKTRETRDQRKGHLPPHPRPRDFLVIPLPQNGFLAVRLQPIVVKSQSFRKLLEFWTFVAENDDKSKKIVYDSGLRPAARQSGGPSLGRSPTRKSSVTPSIKTKSEFLGKQGRHNF